ncbi:ABC transporter substrate-binding protein [Anaerotignum propionicum]|uniref:Amino acid/amide ABC transporter substrate-binding protein, HAAT family (TC 3.A.1.4.-) n=1 Tax=Anaerotignum propionicum DSM 1682 TaxID=991789 RepID=A0A0X8V7Z6_ANAPI|nr:ABC transporter substrate-binding protein [Anaerotignum propionicum]AMJ39816.1 leucine-, isoleucine-, valine-, threonine-, and alanine-binding protein precursor [Anaerotignum propionicum DSM 1682]SHE28182.1 amino acid/amide ABC transporter substrate-binding protein, HAAT family (TC 3.A.1.4.-) [[Clostridium] propionicum DSM 1682] [Anaerotignum propionicum DSM 1682]
MKKFLALTLSAALMLSLAACGGGTTGDDAAKDNAAATGVAIEGDTIKIGVFEPTTGENGGGGMQEVLGMRYANKVNPTVDINGTTYKIQLVEVDNQSDKTAAVTAAQSLISSGVVAVLGSYGSGVSIAAGQTFADAQVPAIGASCTNPQVTLGNDFYFRTCFLDPFQGTVMASYAIEKGYKTAALVSQNGDDYSTGLAAFFKQAFEGMGGTIVADETYQTNESDFNAILTTIKGANPDCIFAPSSIATATLLLPQAQANGIKAQIIASDTWENETIITAAGSAAEGVALSTFFDEHDESNPVAKEFVEGFKAYLNGDPQNLTLNGGSDGVAAVSALGYDAYMSIYEALKALDGAEALNSVALRDALKAVSFNGVTGAISFDENGDAVKNVAYIKQIKDGKFNFLKTQSAE